MTIDPKAPKRAPKKASQETPKAAPQKTPKAAKTAPRAVAKRTPAKPANRTCAKPEKRKTGYPPRPVVEHPVALWEAWEDPPTFSEALDLHMRRHGDTGYGLRRAVCGKGDSVDLTTFRAWRRGAKAPRGAMSLRILSALEHRWRLPPGYFRDKLPHPGRMVANAKVLPLPLSERRRMAWHLPDDFARLPLEKREEIQAWVRAVILSGHTDYRRYQAGAMKQRFALRFLGRSDPGDLGPGAPLDERLADLGTRELGRPLGAKPAPPPLTAEASDLYAFKTATLTSRGRRRNGVWNDQTAGQKMEHLGLMMGALAACPEGPVRGYGAPMRSISLALLAFPAVWDWYLAWRERRRGFFTQWETEMLTVGASLSRRETGWLRQTPRLAERLRPIEGLVTPDDVRAAAEDWDAVCDTQHQHLILRAKEVGRVVRIHRDPFEPILPILEDESPVAAYRKITEEVLRRRPDPRLYPVSSAEVTRAFLMLRLGLHLGLRQKNLRQLLVCPKDGIPTPERQLEALKRGELRWNAKDLAWEVLIPAAAFKNSGSSYFRKNPFRLALPDLGGLYEEIEGYIARDRPVLLRGASDPGVFFVKTMKARSREAAYNQTTFYEAWRLAIQRYGIFNPYTGRGAIEGLLPHGPHNVRDVLATHVLKATGSYEQASYAIQDTPDTIAEHYGRFLPQDKAALAAQVLNRVWG
jgi:hypothetical protein